MWHGELVGGRSPRSFNLIEKCGKSHGAAFPFSMWRAGRGPVWERGGTGGGSFGYFSFRHVHVRFDRHVRSTMLRIYWEEL